jgi:hypothetical protein
MMFWRSVMRALGLQRVFQYYQQLQELEPIAPLSVSSSPVKYGQQTKDAVKQPASQQPKRKANRAHQDTKAQLPKSTRKPAQQERGQDGKQQATPAKPSSQSKRKRLVAPSITVVKSRKQGQPQQDKLDPGLQPAIPAPKSRQHVKQAAKPKR